MHSTETHGTQTLGTQSHSTDAHGAQTVQDQSHPAAHVVEANRWQVLFLPLEDPRVAPLLTELAAEYAFRYGNRFGGAEQELQRYPAADFAAPGGALLIVVENGSTVAGGAFRQLDSQTAELKRIWTSSKHRRRGLARFVLAELEAEALRRGYARLYLTTGPRQPEARELYLSTGYTPRFDVDADPEEVGLLAFGKVLNDARGRLGKPGEPGEARESGVREPGLPGASTAASHRVASHPVETLNTSDHQLHFNHPTGA